MTTTFAPPWTPASDLSDALRSRGHAVVDPQEVSELMGQPLAALQALRPAWDDLPPDAYLRDGGRYRRRRHASFVVHGDDVQLAEHRAHWQPLEYNALHGGLERWFEPMHDEVLRHPAWRALLQRLSACCSATRGVDTPWFVEAHQFRIDTADGIGRPTPEGAHRDGVDFVAVLLVGRDGVKGGETRVFEANGPSGIRFTMMQPWTLLMLDDARVIHESTPIQPADPEAPELGRRDTLVLTFRAHSFQGPEHA